MYESNNYQLGFFIQRRNWGLTIAKVIEIEGVEEGQPIPKDLKEPIVRAKFYRAGQPWQATEENYLNIDRVTYPLTSSYDWIREDPFLVEYPE